MIHLQRLLSYDSNKFDSIFINNQMLRTIYEKDAEIIKREEDIKIKEKQIDERMKQIENLIESFQTKINEFESKNSTDLNNIQQKFDIIDSKLSLIQNINTIDFEYNNQNQFDGIIRYLSKKCGGNVDEKGVVKVSMWPSIYDNRIAKNVVDLDEYDTMAQTNSKVNSYLL